MSLIKQYQTFKADLRGYVEVSFGVYRDRLLPLRRRRDAWDATELDYIRRLGESGAAYALQRFFGSEHEPAARALGGAPLQPEPMAKPELDGHLQGLIKSCHAAAWTPERFLAFVAYLDSNMTPADLDEMRREARRQQALAALAPEPDDRGAGASGVPQKDGFAEMYRGASPVFRQCVKERFALAADEARARAPAGAGPREAKDT
jgi:hypothetical protein